MHDRDRLVDSVDALFSALAMIEWAAVMNDCGLSWSICSWNLVISSRVTRHDIAVLFLKMIRSLRVRAFDRLGVSEMRPTQVATAAGGSRCPYLTVW